LSFQLSYGDHAAVIVARLAAWIVSDQPARYLIPYINGIIALSGALFFQQIYRP
jgi:hypothetical protein